MSSGHGKSIYGAFKHFGAGRLGSVRAHSGLPERHPMTRTQLRVLPHFAMTYITSGSGFYTDAGGAEIDVSRGDALLFPPSVHHCYGPFRETTWDEVCIEFEGPVFDLWLRTGLLSALQPVVHLEPVDYWAQRLREVTIDSSRDPAGPALQNVIRFQALLADIITLSRAAPAGDNDLWLHRACILLSFYPEGTISVHEVARQMGSSYETFRKKFARISGTTPAKYRIESRLNRACDLLICLPEKSIKEIALELAFCDEFHFSKHFKRHIGRSPSDYRAHHAKPLDGAALSPDRPSAVTAP